MNNWVLFTCKNISADYFLQFLMRQIMKLGYQFIKHLPSILIIESVSFLNYYLFITDKSQSCISKMTWSHILFIQSLMINYPNQTLFNNTGTKKSTLLGDFQGKYLPRYAFYMTTLLSIQQPQPPPSSLPSKEGGLRLEHLQNSTTDAFHS